MFLHRNQAISPTNLMIILCIYFRLSVEIFDLIEHRDYFDEKCSKLYQKEAKGIEKLHPTVDYAILMFYESLYSYAAVSIASYIKNSIGQVFDVIIYKPSISKYGTEKKMRFKVFSLNKLNDKFLYVAQYYQLGNSTSYVTGLGKYSYILLSKNRLLDYFMVCFFRMYRAFGQVTRIADNVENSYVRIGDVTGEQITNIPKRFHIFPNYTRYDSSRNTFCVKLHSENNNSVNIYLTKNRMVEAFNNLFGATGCIFSGTYSYYSVESKKLDKSNKNIKNVSCKSNVRINGIRFKQELRVFRPIQDLYESKRVLQALKNIEIEYHSYKKDEKSTEKLKKFRIVFKSNNKGFEFNSDCFVESIIKKYQPNTRIYFIVLCKNYFDTIECEPSDDSCNKFKILQIKKYDISENGSFREKSSSVPRVRCLKDLLEKMFFDQVWQF